MPVRDSLGGELVKGEADEHEADRMTTTSRSGSAAWARAWTVALEDRVAAVG